MKLYEELEKIFPKIEGLFTDEKLTEFKKKRSTDLCNYHFGLGTWIRENLIDPSESELYNLFIELGVKSPDDMSFYIIKLFHDKITSKKK